MHGIAIFYHTLYLFFACSKPRKRICNTSKQEKENDLKGIWRTSYPFFACSKPKKGIFKTAFNKKETTWMVSHVLHTLFLHVVNQTKGIFKTVTWIVSDVLYTLFLYAVNQKNCIFKTTFNKKEPWMKSGTLIALYTLFCMW